MAKLEEYQRKRRFDRTPEPSGSPSPQGRGQARPGRQTHAPAKPETATVGSSPRAEHGDTFVVQKHGQRGCTTISGWRSRER